MKHISDSKLLIAFVAALTLGALLIFQCPVAAYVATEYKTDQVMVVGTLVSLGDKGQILRASTVDSNYLGVVTNQLKGSLYITNAGIVSVIVSDADGTISAGDRIGVSNIAGTATLWHAGEALVGIAKNIPKDWQEVITSTSSKGETQTLRVTSVEVQLISQENNATQANPFLSSIQSTAAGIAGHSVDMWRVVTSLLLGFGGLVLSFGLLFISSRESFFSLGRNPMASHVIMRGLWKMVTIAVLVMCASFTAAYLIVRIG